MKNSLRWIVLVVFAAAIWFGYRAWRSKRPEAPAATVSVDALLARERAAAHFEKGEWNLARAQLEPLVETSAAELEDLVSAAIVAYADRASSDPGPLFERVRARDANHPALRYMEARLALERGEFDAARGHFEAVLLARPDDPATLVGLAATLTDLGRPQESRPYLTRVIERGVEHGQAWYVQAIYRLSQIEIEAGAEERAQELQQVYEQLHRVGYRAPSPRQVDEGTLARLQPPRPLGLVNVSPPSCPEFVVEAEIAPEFAGATELFAHDLDHDGDVDLLAAGPRGLFAAMRSADGYLVESILAGTVDHVRAFDLGNQDKLDLVVSRGSELLLLEHRSGSELLLGDPNASRWAPSPHVWPAFSAPPSDLLLVDFDHEGDLDLLVVGAFGARLYRNDGAAPRKDGQGAFVRGTFVDVTLEAGLPNDVELVWCATEDFDNDADVDFLLGGPNALALLDNVRGGRLEDITPQVFRTDVRFAREPTLADLNADGNPDVFVAGRPSAVWLRQDDGTFVSSSTRHSIESDGLARVTDLDLDGIADVVWASSTSAFEVALAFGSSSEAVAIVGGAAHAQSAWTVVDLERDLDLDLARATDTGLEILRCTGPVGNAARLEPLGLKDNRRSVGAVIEVRTRGAYRRIYWRGEPELVGCGVHPRLDIVRTTWPNGAIQTMLDVAPNDKPFLDTAAGGLLQSTNLIGSCPFLYAWTGSKFAFVTDVLGGTPLGLPMAPGLLVPPDHDEYVALRADQLVERDGVFELQFTEELREVTYLDRARLDVIDHPADCDVHPNERFTFPPFPEAIVHTVRAPLAPVRATGNDGLDWTAALAEIDDVHAAPFEVLEPQFTGLATPHWLELEFDVERVRDAKRLRLICTGWFFWTDASVNMASARTPGVHFVPPTLQVQNAAGVWVDAGPPLGFPAGKSKTMVIEVGAMIDRERPRLRLASTLRLYWDAIHLSVDDGDAPFRVTKLEPASARLWSRGFSRAIASDRRDLPERFEWDSLDPEPRWNQHPGFYTRYGETVALLGEVDDRFVILGSGDALTLKFDARGLPPLPDGWTREYQLFLDGWAKDRDPNTVRALEVEPLPFHGMSGYPYGDDESFPNTPAHEAWRAEWNTRAAKQWIAPLAPRAAETWSRTTALGASAVR